MKSNRDCIQGVTRPIGLLIVAALMWGSAVPAHALQANTNVTIEDFEESSAQNFTVAGYRGCSLALTSRYFVVSGRQSAMFTVTTENIDTHHPPFFSFSPAIKDWSQYQTLVVHMVALPHFDFQGAGIMVELQAATQGGPVYPYELAVPAGVPLTISLPLKSISFKSGVGTVFLAALNESGAYLFDDIELSKTAVKAVTVDTMAPGGLTLPPSETISLQQDSSYYCDNAFYLDPATPLSVVVTAHNPSGVPLTETLDVSGDSKPLLDASPSFGRGDISKSYLVSASGCARLSISLGTNRKDIVLRDRVAVERQNEDYVSKTIIPKIGRKIISGYAGMPYTKNQSPDVQKMVSDLKGLGVNCYTYLIYYHSQNEFDKLPAFLSAAQAAGIEVWVYLVPPSTAKGLGNQPPGGIYPPFGLDYVKWMAELAKLSLKYPNLTLVLIDDFQYDLGYFTLKYTASMYDTLKASNPKLMFGVSVYHDFERQFSQSGYLRYTDAVLFGFQANHYLVPDFGTNPLSLSAEINDYQRDFPGRLVIPCIYFTPHSSWPAGLPTMDYLKEATSIAYDQAGMVWIYTVPPPGGAVYDFARKYIEDSRLGKWQQLR